MDDDEKLVCYRALKTFYSDLEKIFIKKTDDLPSLDYNQLSNKPSIEGIELKGDQSLDKLGMQPKIAEVLEDGVVIEAPVIVPEVVAKEVKAENLYEKKEIDQKLDDKVDVQQGPENAGKGMVIASDGNLIPGEIPGSGGEIGSITNDDIDKIMGR